MKHARAITKVAAISFVLLALSSGADAALLNGAWYGVISSVNPGAGAFTRSVTGNAAQQSMTVNWQCRQPTPCSVTGAQYDFGGQWHVMAPPPNTVTPAPLFVLSLATNTDCSARYGSTARVGAWITLQGQPVVVQCFTTMRFLNTRPPPGAPPIRLAPVTLPRDLLQRLPRGTSRP